MLLQQRDIGDINMVRKYTATQAFKDLGAIDKKHDKGTYTKAQHDSKSRKVLSRLMRK